MKQAGERPRGSRTAIPQYLRSCQAPLHQHQQHPLEGRVPGVGASSDGRYPAKLSARQERTLVSPYATGLCSPGSPTLPSSPPVARHLPSPPVGRHSSSPAQRDDDHAPSKGQHSMMSPDRERHQSPLCTQHHQHHPQPQHHAYIVSYACVTPTHNGYDGGAGGRGGDTSSSHVHNSSSASFASSVSSTTASTSTTTTTTTATSLPSPMSLQDYPIRGTISPLSSQVGVPARRQGGGGGRDGDGPEEISFVFGRPDTPDAAVVGRCMSPPLSCGGGGSKRPLSPGSRDLLPIRRTLSASASTSLVVEREVMSPPPVSSSSSLWSWGEGQMLQGGVCCEHCNACLIDFKRQALRLMFPDTGNGPCLAQCSFPDSQQQQRPFPTTTGSSLAPRLSATRAAGLDGCQPPGPGYCAQTGMFCPRMANCRSISKQGSGGEIFIKQGSDMRSSEHTHQITGVALSCSLPPGAWFCIYHVRARAGLNAVQHRIPQQRCRLSSVVVVVCTQQLVVPGHVRQRLTNGQCQVCETQVRQLKQEAVTMLRSIQLAQTAHSARAANIPALVGSCNLDLQHRLSGTLVCHALDSVPCQ
ncbi:hypothetical protein C0Q70_13177 [Pomacea canaliculata]|uniref:Kinesin-like protein KIF26A/B helical domain-containing protein n=1 Tax=Pomacea canaliculata TaxID=400727 RepID=A0A2T7NWH6_POMCA|nr:hypothetical protein C0Q70_13177 [Pomacea canaliculata]